MPPSGKTAQEMVDALPGTETSANVLKTTLNSLVSDLNVQSITICVAASGAGCGSSSSGSGASGGNSGGNSTNSGSNDDLNGGEIAGIVIGVIIFLAITGGCVFVMMKKKAPVTPK